MAGAATVKGGKHPRELDGEVVDTGMHKHHYTGGCGKKGGRNGEKGNSEALLQPQVPI